MFFGQNTYLAQIFNLTLTFKTWSHFDLYVIQNKHVDLILSLEIRSNLTSPNRVLHIGIHIGGKYVWNAYLAQIHELLQLI